MYDSLKDVYVRQGINLKAGRSLSPKDEILKACLNNISANDILFTQSIEEKNTYIAKDPCDHLQRLRDLLELAVIFLLQKRLTPFKKVLIKKFRELVSQSYWQDFQIQASLQGLIAALLSIDEYKIQDPQQDLNGSVSIDPSNHWNWANFPNLPLHVELGLVWALYGKFHHQDLFLHAAEKLAEWQLNILDYNFSPHWGFFTQEADCIQSQLLTNQYLLFHAIAKFCHNPKMEFAAKKQMEHLKELTSNAAISISSLSVLLSTWIDSLVPESISPQPFSLSPNVLDQETAIVGMRSKNCNLLCTAIGGGTSMGSLKLDSITVSAWGPQLHPLGDQSGFGITHFMHTNKQLKIESCDSHFHLSALSSLTDTSSTQHLEGGYKNTFHTNTWMDFTETFDGKDLSIQCSFINRMQDRPVYFVFYVKAGSCVLNEQSISSTSLSGYDSQSCPILFEQDAIKMKLDLHQIATDMRVIPLRGNDSFWGANYLVSYLIEENYKKYIWKLTAI